MLEPAGAPPSPSPAPPSPIPHPPLVLSFPLISPPPCFFECGLAALPTNDRGVGSSTQRRLRRRGGRARFTVQACAAAAAAARIYSQNEA